MNKMENGRQSAFPNNETDNMGNPKYQHLGVTKREYFAAMAMQGALANNYPNIVSLSSEQVARLSIEHADELLKQLDQ